MEPTVRDVEMDEGYACKPELPSQVVAKRLGRVGSFTLATLILANLTVGAGVLLPMSAALGLALSIGMGLVPLILDGRVPGAAPWETTLLWKAQTFAFGVAGVSMSAASAIPGSLFSGALSSVMMVLMFLATFTEFCLGRVAYMLLARAAGLAR